MSRPEGVWARRLFVLILLLALAWVLIAFVLYYFGTTNIEP